MVARSPLLAAGRSGGGDVLVTLACGRVTVSPDVKFMCAHVPPGSAFGETRAEYAVVYSLVVCRGY